jgi:hydrogenase/urease accessory protein HupE
MVRNKKTILLRIIIVLSGIAMIITLVDKMFWVMMASIGRDNGPVPRVYTINEVLLLGILISLIALWKWPWIAAVVAWVNLISIASRFTPWNDESASAFFYGFTFDHLFFVAANVGCIGVLLLKRTSRDHPRYENPGKGGIASESS